jgi:transcription antitermination factor NusG
MAGVASQNLDSWGGVLVDAVRLLARRKELDNTSLSVAVDAYLFSFYNAGVDIDTVVSYRIDSDSLCRMPQTESLRLKYAAPIRRYIFPLEQRKQTPKKIREHLESNFRLAARFYQIKLGDFSPSEFITHAWISAARSCGVQLADICACCHSATEALHLTNVVPSDLSRTQVEEILTRVANTIVDMTRYWYAFQFVGDEKVVRREITDVDNTSNTRIYYPIEEIYRKVGKKLVVENKPTIRNIIFVQTMPSTLAAIVRNRTADSRYFVIRNRMSKSNDYAIIPNEQMRRFSALVSNGLDIMGEEEINQTDIVEGDYVHINEGMFKGCSGRVVKVKNSKSVGDSTILKIEADKFGSEMEEVLGKYLYITVSQELVNLAEIDGKE